MSNLIVEAINVTKTYNLGKPNEVTAVKDASLQIKEGNLVVLKGPSGSGKTTLLSLIGCQTKPTRGEVVILGKRISKLPEKFMNLHKRSHIGFIFQHFQLIAGMSVLDNIVL
ncbi:MAG: ATP-binding cassette domain-containing protein, partial [Deltaproteobacteria bacterium]|nr:ATP-binding cassette domain-containing protein [Deltaproteobacteria bacterium]